jgi:hypothetical protein
MMRAVAASEYPHLAVEVVRIPPDQHIADVEDYGIDLAHPWLLLIRAPVSSRALLTP